MVSSPPLLLLLPLLSLPLPPLTKITEPGDGQQLIARTAARPISKQTIIEDGLAVVETPRGAVVSAAEDGDVLPAHLGAGLPVVGRRVWSRRQGVVVK